MQLLNIVLLLSRYVSDKTMSSLSDEICVRFSDGERLKDLVSNLLQWGCCVRCIVRLLGVKSADVYRTYDLPALVAWAREVSTASGSVVTRNDSSSQCDSQSDTELNGHRIAETVESVSSEKPNSTVCDDLPCICCFGVLQDKYCRPQFVEEIADAVARQDYEFKTFLCSVSLPVCLVPREHAVWLALAELCPGEFIDAEKNAIASVKDVWKWINGPLLASSLGVPFDQKSLFEVILTFEYQKNEEECSFLSRLYPDVFRRRKLNNRGVEVFNRSNVARAIENTKPDVFRRCFRCPPMHPQMFATTSPITCQQSALYIAGRYVSH
jgi:hypothetical protein